MIRVRTFVVAACALFALSVHAATFTVTNTNDSGAGSLRDAVTQANALAGADRIEFNIASGGSQLIVLDSLLPVISSPVTIDGTTQPGYAGAPLIGIDGSNLPPVQYVTTAFDLEASGSSVIGLAITNFKADVTWSREGAGIIIGATGCSVTKCYIGLQRNGKTAAGNTSGIRIDVGGATIGAPGAGNVICGNYRGIDHIGLVATTASTIQNNIIGLGPDGRTDIPNTYGMFVTSDIIKNNRLANQYEDIAVTGSNSVVTGNKLGVRSDGSVLTTRAGAASLIVSNGFAGSSTNIRVGGSAAGEGNEVAAASVGIYATQPAGVQITGNNVHDNYTGVEIDQSPGAKITGNTIHDNYTGVYIKSGAGNLISANSMYGDSTGIWIDSGANLGIGYPVVTSAKSANGATTVSGTFDGDASSAYKIEIFSSPACASAGRGEGKTFLGSVNVTTNASGHGTFETSFPTAVAQGSVVTATATDSSSNTSEFSACEPVKGPGVFSVAASGVTEGGSVTVTVNRLGGSVGTVSVDYATVNGSATGGSDFTAKSGTLTFADGETQKTFSVATTDDSLHEATEAFNVTLSNPTGGATINIISVAVTIDDNDPAPAISADDISLLRPASGTAIATFTISLSSASALTASISYHTENGTAVAGADYQPASGVLTFAPGQTVKTVDVTILGSSVAGPNRDFRLVLNATEALPATLSAKCTIFSHNVGISPATQSIAAGGKGKLTVTFGRAIDNDATLVVKSSKPEAFSVPATVSAAAGATSASFQITALTAPSSARIEVTLPAALGGDVLAAGVSSYEKATLVLQPSTLTIIAGRSATVKGSLSPASDQPQVIALDDVDPSIADAPATFTIPAGGDGTFVVNGIRRGQTTLRATLPARFGSQIVILPVDVIDAPVTPVIFSVSPATGATAGGTPVSVAGSKLRGDCTLAFGGTPAQTTFVSDTQLTATTPAHPAGTVNVSLTCGQDTFTLANGFTFFTAGPAIASIAPAFGNVAGGTIVQIEGSGLSSACGVFFGSSAAHNVALDGNALIATAPQHQAGAVDVTVRCGGETATQPAGFTFTASEEPAATISSVDPLFGSSGQNVTITGLRFRAGDRIVFGTTPAVVLFTSNDTHLVRIPDVPLGKIAITLTDPNDRVSTTGPIFTIVEPIPPKIVSVSPANVISGQEVVLEGEGFRTGYSFAIGDHVATTLSMSYRHAVIRVPQLDAGSYPVNALNSAGNVAAVGPPVTVGARGVALIGVSLGCASTDGGGTVTIHGSGFAGGAAVSIGDAAASDVVVVDAQTITATIPPSMWAGAANITVTNPNGDNGSLTNAFRYTSPYDPDGCGARRRTGGR